MRKTNIILLILISTIFSCKKDKGCFQGRDKGDGTISFYVDGELWQNSCEYNNKGSINGTANESMSMEGGAVYGDTVNFSLIGKRWGSSTIYISSTTQTVNEICEVGDGYEILFSAFDPFEHCKICLKFYDSEKVYVTKRDYGFLKLTRKAYDSTLVGEKWHLEGIFEATLFNVKDSTDFIEITDGFWNN